MIPITLEASSTNQGRLIVYKADVRQQNAFIEAAGHCDLLAMTPAQGDCCVFHHAVAFLFTRACHGLMPIISSAVICVFMSCIVSIGLGYLPAKMIR